MSTSFPSSGGGAVASVNGATGVVVLDASDVGADAAGAAAAVAASSQPLDSDLTAIAALSTTTFGRALLALADAAAGRTAFGLGSAATSATSAFEPAGSVATEAARAMAAEALAALKANNLSDLASASTARTNLGLGTAATQDSSAFDASGAAAAAQAASQPLDSDLTAIAALTTTSYGRAFLALADAAAGRTALGLGTAATSASSAFDAAGAAAAAQAASQPLDSDLTALAAIAPANDDLVQRKAGAWTNRTPAQVKTDLALVKGDVGLGNVDNTADTAKPVSTAQQTALDLKAPLASPALTGTPSAPTAAVATNTTQVATTAYADRAGLAKPTASMAPSGYYVAVLQAVGATGSNQFLAGTPGRGQVVPFTVSRSFTPSSFALEVTGAVASTFIRMGLYADGGSGTPGTLIVDLGQVGADTGGVKLLSNTTALVAGVVYWVVAVPQGTGSGSITVRTQSSAAGAEVGRKAANASTASSTVSLGFDVSGITGAMPSTLTLNDGAGNNAPRILMVVP